MMEIGISEAARLAGVKAHTLRYYESIGLIRAVERNAAGLRIYSESDITWLEFLRRLRATGMPIRQMKEYARLRNEGDHTAAQRKQILAAHLKVMDRQIQKLLEVRKYVAEKINIYQKMEEAPHE